MYVKCIKDNYKFVTKNKLYEVFGEDNYSYFIEGDDKMTWRYSKDLFEVVEKNVSEKYDKIHKPFHYNKGIQTIDYINSWDMNYMEGNIIKYVTRYKYKNGVEDLEKAKEYLERLIEREVKKNEKY